MRAVIDTHLTVEKSQLPKGAAEMIRSALTIPNDQKETAIREGVWGADDLPDFFYLYEEAPHTMRLPRGFAHQLAKGMRAMGKVVEFDDRTTLGDASLTHDMPPIKMRDHQPEAVKKILEHRQGIYQAPPGSGKTVTVLETWRNLPVRGIIIVDKTNIAEQWRDRAKQFLGIKTGLIGDGVWEEEDLTIALIQTLWSRREQLTNDGWWERFGLACLDECHHVPANSFGDIMQRFPARWRFGVSATPERKVGSLRFAEAILGRVFHMTSKEELRDSKILVKPTIKVVRTDFDFEYKPTVRYGRKIVRRNNYSSMMKALVEDKARNELIMHHVAGERGHHHLVISRFLGHLDTLQNLVIHKAGWPESRAFMLTGKQDREERMRIIEQVMKLPESVVFSTIADEALDVPIMDRVHLTFPTRQAAKVTQQIGRIERVHPGKKDARVYDYFDQNIGVLKSQFRERRREVYDAQKYTIEEGSALTRQRPSEATK